jgi:hypothetical protein
VTTRAEVVVVLEEQGFQLLKLVTTVVGTLVVMEALGALSTVLGTEAEAEAVLDTVVKA